MKIERVKDLKELFLNIQSEYYYALLEHIEENSNVDLIDKINNLVLKEIEKIPKDTQKEILERWYDWK